MQSNAGIGDSAEVEIIGYAEALREKYLSEIPSCPHCLVKMVPVKRWKGGTRPEVKCENTYCPRPGMWTPEAYDEYVKNEGVA